MSPKLSQVLLTDDNWIERCLTVVPESEFGVEWASGRGALTRGLIQRWSYLLGLELDFSFCRHLHNKFSNHNADVVCTDIKYYPLPVSDKPYPLVGNLPYHLTGPLLIKILAEKNKLSRFQGLIQKEVAERVVASPGDKNFGSLALLYRVSGDVKMHFVVPAGAFSPVPAVDSAWIDFIPNNKSYNFEKLKSFARQVFRFPRKTLLNNLAATSGDKKHWRSWFEEKGWKPAIRAHRMEVSQLLEVYDQWQKL